MIGYISSCGAISTPKSRRIREEDLVLLSGAYLVKSRTLFLKHVLNKIIGLKTKKKKQIPTRRKENLSSNLKIRVMQRER